MKHVELIRKRIIRGQQVELQRLRSFVSTTDGNTEVLERLQGDEGALTLARICEFILAELGHATAVETDDTEKTHSKTRRAVAKVLGGRNAKG